MDEQTVPSVPGTPEGEPTLGEHTGEVQPPAPNPVPATAAPAVDQVTVNTNLRKVASEAQSLVTYVETFLENHPAAEDILKSLGEVITVVEASVK